MLPDASKVTETVPLPARAYDALLFDMDGTILSSIVIAERIWADWGRRQGLNVAAFLPTIHGVRTIETIRRQGIPGLDPEIEAAAITQAEVEDVTEIEVIAGAAAFLTSLPVDRWAIVTSATRPLAERRIDAAGLPTPRHMITAEDVDNGKPAPDCFLMAADQLGFGASECLVFEDTPAGIAAPETAGASVVVVTVTHRHPLPTKHLSIKTFEGLIAWSSPSGRLEVRTRG